MLNSVYTDMYAIKHNIDNE